MPRLLDANTIGEIHKYIRDILENIGIAFGTEKALDLFKKHGAKVEGDRVFISNELLEKALSSLPKYDYTDLTPQRITATSPFGNVPIIYNNESKKYQKGTIDDVIKMYQLTQTSDSTSVLIPVWSNQKEMIRRISILDKLPCSLNTVINGFPMQ